jgi:hypothetical protein
LPGHGGGDGSGHDGLGFGGAFWDKLREVILNVASNGLVKVEMVGLLTVDATFFDDSYLSNVSRRTAALQ